MKAISSTTRKLLELSQLSGVGPATLRRFASDPGIDTLEAEDIAASNNALTDALDDGRLWRTARAKAEAQIEACEQIGARIISPVDKDYPSLLSSTKDDPFLLYVRGNFAPDPEKSIAIIGTREPTPHGIAIAERMTDFFVGAGWSVVSGLALGCDAIAHRQAIKSGGHTVAVLAHGLHTTAPARHRALAEEIVESGGALVSQYPFGAPAIGPQFVQRDKTQAGLAQGVVMVQSDLQGGSLHASRAILAYGRWLIVPNPTDRDRIAEEPKVQANLLLAEGNDRDKMDLLRIKTPSMLTKLLIVRSREDYDIVLKKASLGGNDAAVIQPSMF
ncbi:DNA-processing protein DprA [Luteimonas aestuarii]|uniref:DNA-processing protein DprA n=1 Tax=Luteimonas aestuarii TaxID=453837 RepID=A0A4V3AMB0_9GAMM|nr:DNA-processing protein DprA [Luteimonas aestuarii]TDK26192.1 DNA-processing protein DprA [Luteimonas aestuarii]